LKKVNQLGKTLESQVKNDLYRQGEDQKERRVFVKPHFGPEDPDPSAVDTLKRMKILETN